MIKSCIISGFCLLKLLISFAAVLDTIGFQHQVCYIYDKIIEKRCDRFTTSKMKEMLVLTFCVLHTIIQAEPFKQIKLCILRYY